MFRAVFRSTFKTIIRSPVTLLCIAALLFYVIASKDGVTQFKTAASYHKLTYNAVGMPLQSVVPVFMSVIICVDMMRDMRNRFFDIVRVAGTNMLKYLFAKLCLYLIIFYIISAAVSYANIFGAYMSLGYMRNLPISGILWDILIRVLIMSIPVSLTYISTSVFITVFTRSASAGIVAGIIYMTLKWILPGYMHTSFYGEYMYGIPAKLNYFMYFYKRPDLAGDTFAVPCSEVYRSLGCIAALAVALLAAGYFKLIKMHDD